MTEKTRKASDFAAAFLPNLSSAFDVAGFAAIAARNLEAMTQASAIITEAAIEIGNTQLAYLKGLAEIQPDATPSADSNSLAGLMISPTLSGRRFTEATMTQMRKVSERISECCSDVTRELESCARDNMATVTKSSSDAAEPEPSRPTAVSAPPPPKAVGA